MAGEGRDVLAASASWTTRSTRRKRPSPPRRPPSAPVQMVLGRVHSGADGAQRRSRCVQRSRSAESAIRRGASRAGAHVPGDGPHRRIDRGVAGSLEAAARPVRRRTWWRRARHLAKGDAAAAEKSLKLLSASQSQICRRSRATGISRDAAEEPGRGAGGVRARAAAAIRASPMRCRPSARWTFAPASRRRRANGWNGVSRPNRKTPGCG